MRWRLGLLWALQLLVATPSAYGASLWLYNVHTSEELKLTRLEPTKMEERAWRRSNHFFRSWRTQKRRTVHPRLLRTLAHLQQHFGNQRIEVVSGYRAPVAGDELNSYHQVGRAADIRISGVPKRELFDFCRGLARMGCGFYPNADFIHIDVRGASGIWVDLSPPGTPRRYVANPARWLSRH